MSRELLEQHAFRAYVPDADGNAMFECIAVPLDVAERLALPERSEADRSWISVDERLPEEKASVLVLDHSIGGAPSVTIATYLRGLKGYNDQWMRMVQPWQSGPTYQHITHWMPLPETP